jgi:hypothetical protein
MKQADLFAQRVREAEPADSIRQIDFAYRIALGRPPRPEEVESASSYLKQHTLSGLTHVLLNLNEFVYLR